MLNSNQKYIKYKSKYLDLKSKLRLNKNKPKLPILQEIEEENTNNQLEHESNYCLFCPYCNNNIETFVNDNYDLILKLINYLKKDDKLKTKDALLYPNYIYNYSLNPLPVTDSEINNLPEIDTEMITDTDIDPKTNNIYFEETETEKSVIYNYPDEDNKINDIYIEDIYEEKIETNSEEFNDAEFNDDTTFNDDAEFNDDTTFNDDTEFNDDLNFDSNNDSDAGTGKDIKSDQLNKDIFDDTIIKPSNNILKELNKDIKEGYVKTIVDKLDKKFKENDFFEKSKTLKSQHSESELEISNNSKKQLRTDRIIKKFFKTSNYGDLVNKSPKFIEQDSDESPKFELNDLPLSPKSSQVSDKSPKSSQVSDESPKFELNDLPLSPKTPRFQDSDESPKTPRFQDSDESPKSESKNSNELQTTKIEDSIKSSISSEPHIKSNPNNVENLENIIKDAFNVKN